METRYATACREHEQRQAGQRLVHPELRRGEGIHLPGRVQHVQEAEHASPALHHRTG